MAHTFQSVFHPGDKVVVGGDVPGVVERITFARHTTAALVLVEWWDSGRVHSREFHEDEIQHRRH